MNHQLNYPSWVERHRYVLETLPNKQVMMFFSGGKDSSIVLHLLQLASADFHFTFETHTGVFPHHVFSPEDRQKLDTYWQKRGVTINWHDVLESDDQLATALAEGTSPCLVCNTAKKRQLLNYIKGSGLDTASLVIVISYSLWDLVSATIEHILGSVYASPQYTPSINGKPREERFLETFQRFYPLLQFTNGFSVFKPLIYYNDQAIIDLIRRENIPLLCTSCNYKEYRPKRLFGQYYEKMNLQFEFQDVLNFARNTLHLPDEAFFTQLGEEGYLKKAI